MKLTGLQIRNMQMLQDLLNKNKYAELYKVYHRLLGGLDERGYKVC